MKNSYKNIKINIKKFNLFSFNNNKKVKEYIKIFHLGELIKKKFKEDKIKSIKNEILNI